MRKLMALGLLLTAYNIAAGDSFNQSYAYSNYWRLSRQLAEDNLNGNPLFLGTRSLTIFAYNSDYNPSNRYGVTVVSDPYAGRLIVGVNNWNRLSHYNIDLPCGLASSPQRLVFATSSLNKVYVLYYNSGTYNLVNAPRNWVYFTENGCPSYVCWDDGGTADYDNDSFWVIRYNGGSATKYRYSFNWVAPPEDPRFEYAPILTIGSLDYPISIARGREENNSCPGCEAFGHNEWLYILELNGTIKCYTHPQTPPDNDNTDFNFEFSFNPEVNVNLRSISVDHTGVIWGTDTNNHRLITYYNNGSTLVPLDAMFSYGTGNSPGQLYLPGKISLIETRTYNEDEDGNSWYSIDPYPALYVRENWSATTGGIKGSRGVDILNLAGWVYPQDPVNRPVEITYKVTAFASISIHIINSSNVTIRTISRSDIPGDVAVIWDGKDDNGNQAPIDIYTIEICGHTVDFNTNSTPYFEVFEANSYSCIQDYLDSRTISYEVVDPNPENIEFHYHWEVDNGRLFHPDDPYHGYSVLDYDGDGVGTITYAPPRDWTSAAPGPGTSQIECTVSDLNGVASLSTMRIISFRRCGEECPFLYILNGSDTLRQNNILNASIDTSGGGNLVYDYIFLHDSPEPQSGRYEFFVREDENAVDSLDWVSLVTIDHEPGADLTLSPDGRMYDILLTVPPSSAVDDRGVDVLQELLYVDNIFYVRDDSGWIDLTYEGLDTMSLCLETTTSGSSVIPPAKGITGLITGRPRPNILTISVMDDAGNWNVVERAFPRRRPQPFFVDLSEHFAASIQVRYKWTRRYRADFIGFSWVRLLRSGISLLKPSIAVLNDSIKVLNTLRRPDNRFVGFVSEEFINLSFPYYQIPEDKTRDFVFLCRGKYYVSDSLNPPKIASDDLLPKELSLNQNYPNPFNSNTIIRFANPTDQHISIEIFDILGRKVKTLLSEPVQAGYHEILWEGKNSAGNSVSSGVYFCKLNTSNKQLLKKMLLLK